MPDIFGRVLRSPTPELITVREHTLHTHRNFHRISNEGL